MRLRLTRPLIMFDLETTGVDPRHDRIVELAALKLWPDGQREEKCRRFNPGRPIPKEATAVHGITDDDVAGEPPFHKVARGDKGIAAFFRGCDLGGYNVINFDIPMLQAELTRANAALDLSEVAVVDAYRIFISRERRDLEAALRFYCDKGHPAAHSALGDVQATMDVLVAQLDHYGDLPAQPWAIDYAIRNPEWVDRVGKLKWVDDDVTVTFGQHKGKTLRSLAQSAPDYLQWMLKQGVVPDAEHHLRDALSGQFHARPNPEAPPEGRDDDEAVGSRAEGEDAGDDSGR